MEEYKKKCSGCGTEQSYGAKSSLTFAIKHNKLCKPCRAKERANRTEVRKANSERQKGKRMGEDNHFYGKKHSVEARKLIKQHRSTQIIPKGIENKMFGKTYEEMYGEERASELKSNLSKHNSGENNGMFGKPAPQGSGNGWSGWYNDWFFRSILELSYMIKVIERYNMDWENGEDRKHTITYTDKDGVVKNYHPDFIINTKYVVEIKPTKLMKTLKVMEKVDAGIEYCNKNNMIYKITNVPSLTTEEFRELIDTNKVKLTKRYTKKYNEKYKNN
jgi:hypothetical protein